MTFLKNLFPAIFVVLLVISHSGYAATPNKWVEDSFEDFRDGTFDSSGQNLYVTAKGQVKTIHRFDLNTDGFLDLVFCSSHDFKHNTKPTLLTQPKGRKGGQISRLPMDGCTGGAVGDMNKDGFLDIILVPNDNGISSRRYARILWGGKDGWVRQRETTLETNLARAVQIADIDVDGWDDIAVLNGNRWAVEEGKESMLRIYWGSEEGFKQEVYKDVLIHGRARAMVVTDIDGDQRADIAIIQKPIVYDSNDKEIKGSKSEMLVYWNDGIRQGGGFPEPQKIALETSSALNFRVMDYDKDGKLDFLINGAKSELYRVDPTTKDEKRSYSGMIHVPGTGPRRWGQLKTIETPTASDFFVDDLNGDGNFDIVTCNRLDETNSIEIQWGQGINTFKDGTTKLDLPRIQRIAVADIDGDGNLDIAAGSWRGVKVYESPSYIFYGDGEGGFELGDIEIETADATKIITAPTDSGKGMRVIFCNVYGGRIYEDVPVYVYWGGKDGFDPKRVREYPNLSGNFGNAADLDDDGNPDLMLGSCVHAETRDTPELGLSIYWGGKDGPKNDKKTTLHEYGLAGTNVADFNKDGWLDVIYTANKVNAANEPSRAVVRYGSASGFGERVVIPFAGAIWSNVVADFNKDGWLDFAASTENNNFGILWGGPEGFSADRLSSYPYMESDNMRAADLNADGWLDLIVTSFKVAGTRNYNYGTRIFWGAPEGFSPFNGQQLRGYAAFGVSVADYDNDGYLDLHIPNYKMAQVRDSISSFLYWGGPEGYSDFNFTPLLQDSGSGSQSADYNGDGLIDIAIVCHTRGGQHYSQSRVYYNDGNRFASPKVQFLPTIGPHYSLNADVGNQYDRSYKQTYVSSVYKWEGERKKGRLSVKAKTPGKSRLEFAVRSATTEDQLASKPWRPIKKNLSLTKTDRCMQYKATFISDNGDRYPVLDRVAVSF